MLTEEQNALVTHTGPGTPGGSMFRSYWLPVALSEELGRDAIPVDILSEALVLFRTPDGKPALIGRHCAHRGVDLSYGRCEDGGLRCVYHGWLFGADGRCLEQPGEPANSTFRDKVRHLAYPCAEFGGVILAYLGAGAPPLVPQLPFVRVPADHVFATKSYHECNYLQGNEGNLDPQHVSFLHRLEITPDRPRREALEIISADVAPEFLIEETAYGFRTYTQRVANEREHYVRVTNFIMPSVSAFVGSPRVDPKVAPPDENDGCQLHWHVPIDDTHHWKYQIIVRWEGPIDREYVRARNTVGLSEHYELPGNRRNRYLQDRDEMARGETFIGMGRNFQQHDKFATESQRPISDRTREHLGVTDRGVITMRKQLLAAVEDVRAGREPQLVSRDPAVDPLADMVVKTARIPRDANPSGFWRAAAVALAFALLAPLAPIPARALQGSPVEIEALLSLTGAGAFFGNSAVKTLKIIEDRTNAGGGIAGRPLKFIVEDDGSNPQQALQVMQQLAARNVPAVLGPSLTATCQAIYPVMFEKGPVAYCISPSVVTAPDSFMFANSSSSVDGMSAAVRFFRQRGMTRLAVLNATDASGQSVDKTLSVVFGLEENRDLQIVAYEHFAPTDISVSAQMSRIKAAAPQGLISWAVGSPFATVLRGANDAGLAVPILTGAGNMTLSQIKQYAPYMPKHLYFEGFLSLATDSSAPAGVKKARDAMHQAFAGAGIVPDGGNLGIYDMAMIYIDAFRHYNGTPTAQQVHDYIESLHDYPGSNGIYDYTTYSQRGLGQSSNVIETYDPAKNTLVAVSKPGGYR